MNKLALFLLLFIISKSLLAQTDTIPYATVYIYRESELQGPLKDLGLILNSKTIHNYTFGKIEQNSKMYFKIYNEGANEISLKTDNGRAIKLNIKFGESYFIKVGLQYGRTISRPTIQQISKKQAVFDMERIENIVSAFEQ